MKKLFQIIFSVFVVVFCWRCSEIYIPHYSGFEGITETSSNSSTPIGETDQSDWMPRYDYNINDSEFVSLAVLPAFPNPTDRFFTLSYLLPSNEKILIWIEDSFGSKEVITYDSILAGKFDVKIDLLYDQNGKKRISEIYRLFFRVCSKEEIPLIKGDIKLL